jgi:hypothetical protein
MPDAHCTRGLVCKRQKQKPHTSIQGSGGNPTFPAQWLYGLYALSPECRAFCLRRLTVFGTLARSGFRTSAET